VSIRKDSDGAEEEARKVGKKEEGGGGGREGGREGGTLGTSWSSTQLAGGIPVSVHSLSGSGLHGCTVSGPRGMLSWKGREGGGVMRA
jgi:hypothetical protein